MESLRLPASIPFAAMALRSWCNKRIWEEAESVGGSIQVVAVPKMLKAEVLHIYEIFLVALPFCQSISQKRQKVKFLILSWQSPSLP